MALYISHSIFHLARLLYVRPETFGPPYYVLDTMCKDRSCYDLPGWPLRIFKNTLSHFSVPVKTRVGHILGTSRVTT